MILAIATLVGVVLAALAVDMYFPYCFFLPYFIALYVTMMTGRFPAEFYEEMGGVLNIEFWPQSVFVGGLIAAIVMVAVVVLLYVYALKNKKKGLLIAAILYSIDTGIMFLLNGIDFTFLIDYLLHAVGLYYLWSGYSALLKLEKMPPEPDPAAAPMAGEFYTGDDPTIQAEVPTEVPVEETPVEEPAQPETPSDEFRL